MLRICAWCGKELGDSSPGSAENAPVTHGICDGCSSNLAAQAGVPLREFLDDLGAPVLLVDSEGTIVTANAAVCAMLGKTLALIEGFKGGDVFECAFARLPEGCGSTVHCSGCTIRRTVMDTHLTGESHIHFPAYLNRQALNGIRILDLSISTEKAGDIVFLRIDGMKIREEN